MEEVRREQPGPADYLRLGCDYIDPGQLGATTGTSVDGDALLTQAELVCLAVALEAPAALPLCALIPYMGGACFAYDVVYDGMIGGGYYYEHLFLPLTPAPTSANPTATTTATSTPTPRDTPTPLPTITLSPTPAPQEDRGAE